MNGGHDKGRERRNDPLAALLSDAKLFSEESLSGSGTEANQDGWAEGTEFCGEQSGGGFKGWISRFWHEGQYAASRQLARSDGRVGWWVFALAKQKWNSIFQEMLARDLSQLAAERLRLFPALTLVGPRQCGKTTLARTLSRTYFNLEDPEERTRLDATWNDAICRRGACARGRC